MKGFSITRKFVGAGTSLSCLLFRAVLVSCKRVSPGLRKHFNTGNPGCFFIHTISSAGICNEFEIRGFSFWEKKEEYKT